MFQRNSIPGLADVWSAALAAEGRKSPDEDLEALKRVTLADVNRVAKQYLVETNSITATLKPVPNGEPVSGKGFGGAESLTAQPTNVTWSSPTSLPGLVLDSATGKLTGTPPIASTYYFTITASAPGFASDTRTFTYNVTMTLGADALARSAIQDDQPIDRGLKRGREEIFESHVLEAAFEEKLE